MASDEEGKSRGPSSRLRRMVAQAAPARLAQNRVVLVLLALLMLAALLAGWHALAPPAGEYILIIDAGSSGTRLYAYTWKPGAAPGAPPAVAAIPPSAAAHVVPRRAMPAKRAYQRVETEPGLDQFAGDAQALHTKAIGPLLRWAEAVVPRRLWARTPVFLFATAGLRKLPDGHQEQLMNSVRSALRHSPFRFQPEWARIITGEDEGVFGWVALNYLVGAFNSSALTTALGGRQAVPGHERGRTVGVLDLGGSSLEVAFELEASTAGAQQLAKDAVNLTVLGRTHSLYVHVHHNYGLNDAFDRSITLLLRPAPPSPVASPQPPSLPSPSPSPAAAAASSGRPAEDRGGAGQGGGSPGSTPEAASSSSSSTPRAPGTALGGGGSSSPGSATGATARPVQSSVTSQGLSAMPDAAEAGAGGGSQQEGRRQEREEQAGPGLGSSVRLPEASAGTADAALGAAASSSRQLDPDMAADLAMHGAQHGEQEQQPDLDAAARTAADLAGHNAQQGERLQQQASQQQQQQQQVGGAASEGGALQHHRRALQALLAQAVWLADTSLPGAGGRGLVQLHRGQPRLPAGQQQQGSADGYGDLPALAAATAYEAISLRLAAEERAMRPRPGGSWAPSGQQQQQGGGGSRHLLSRAAGKAWLEGDQPEKSAAAGATVSTEQQQEQQQAAGSDSGQQAGAAGTAGGDRGAGKPPLREVPHPCLHEGYAKPYARLVIQGQQPDPPEVLLVGRPDHRACAELAVAVVNASAPCDAPACVLGAPAPPATGPFHALTGFYVVYHFFGLHSRQEMAALEQMGREFCGKPWRQVEEERANEIHVDRYCFRAPFVRALLDRGLRVPPERVQLGSPDIGWTLGAAILEGSRLGLGGGSEALPLALSHASLLPHLPRLDRRTKVLVAAGAALLLLGVAALARRPGAGGPGQPSPGKLPVVVGALARELAGVGPGGMRPSLSFSASQAERGLGGMLAIPGSPRLGGGMGSGEHGGGGGSTPSTPVFQRMFGTPPKKRGPPSARDLPAGGAPGAVAWGQPAGAEFIRRDVSFSSLSRLARSQAVSRRGISTEEIR